MANTVLSAGQIASYAETAGFAGPDLITAVAVALAESGGNTWAINNDSDGTQDQGLWQINTVHAAQFPGMVTDPNSSPGSGIAAVGASSMFDPLTNARAACTVSAGGSTFAPWSTYTSGSYQQFLTVATAAVPYAGGGGIGGQNPDTPGSPNTGGSAGAANPGLGYALVDDHDRPIISKTPANQIATVPVPDQINGLVIAGLGDVSQYVTGGTVELDADQIGQVQFTLQDPTWQLAPSLQLNTPVTYAGLSLRIATREVQQGGGTGGQWVITAQTAIAQQMKVTRNPPTMPKGVAAGDGTDTLSGTPTTTTGATSTPANTTDTGADTSGTTDSGVVTGLPTTPVGVNPNPSTSITPTDYIAYWCKKFGGELYYGAPTYTQAVISPLPVSQGVNQNVYGENLWDLCNRLASNYGFWLVDVDGHNMWFGPPGPGSLTVQQNQGIIFRGLPFKVGWNGAWGGDPSFDAIQIPDCTESTNDILTPVTVTAQLPRSRGEQVRPCMSMWLKGVPNFDADGEGQAYVVTKVTWAMDSGQTPVTVTAVTPIDPIPTDLSLLPQPSIATYGAGNQNAPYDTLTQIGPDPKVRHLADDFVTYALEQLNIPYVWRGESPAGFDCSGLIEYCCAQVGITFPAAGYSGTRSQEMYLECAATSNVIPVAQAAGLRGSIVFTGYEGDEHVGISLGDNRHTLEATHTGSFVLIIDNGDITGIETRFQYAATIPGMDYSIHEQPLPATPPEAPNPRGGESPAPGA